MDQLAALNTDEAASSTKLRGYINFYHGRRPKRENAARGTIETNRWFHGSGPSGGMGTGPKI